MTERVTGAQLETFGAIPENYHLILKLHRAFQSLFRQPNAVTTDPVGLPYQIYGSGWHFLRFLGDVYFDGVGSATEAAFFRAQSDSLIAPGPVAFPEILGQPLASLLEPYATAVMFNGSTESGCALSFCSYGFPSLSEVMEGTWEGSYPFPVTVGTTEAGIAGFESGEWSGPMGESGIRIHDFSSSGTGGGIEVHVDVFPPARVVVVRLR
jgi:hypothetical protein